MQGNVNQTLIFNFLAPEDQSTVSSTLAPAVHTRPAPAGPVALSPVLRHSPALLPLVLMLGGNNNRRMYQHTLSGNFHEFK